MSKTQIFQLILFLSVLRDCIFLNISSLKKQVNNAQTRKRDHRHKFDAYTVALTTTAGIDPPVIVEDQSRVKIDVQNPERGANLSSSISEIQSFRKLITEVPQSLHGSGVKIPQNGQEPEIDFSVLPFHVKHGKGPHTGRLVLSQKRGKKIRPNLQKSITSNQYNQSFNKNIEKIPQTSTRPSHDNRMSQPFTEFDEDFPQYFEESSFNDSLYQPFQTTTMDTQLSFSEPDSQIITQKRLSKLVTTEIYLKERSLRSPSTDVTTSHDLPAPGTEMSTSLYLRDNGTDITTPQYLRTVITHEYIHNNNSKQMSHKERSADGHSTNVHEPINPLNTSKHHVKLHRKNSRKSIREHRVTRQEDDNEASADNEIQQTHVLEDIKNILEDIDGKLPDMSHIHLPENNSEAESKSTVKSEPDRPRVSTTANKFQQKPIIKERPESKKINAVKTSSEETTQHTGDGGHNFQVEIKPTQAKSEPRSSKLPKRKKIYHRRKYPHKIKPEKVKTEQNTSTGTQRKKLPESEIEKLYPFKHKPAPRVQTKAPQNHLPEYEITSQSTKKVTSQMGSLISDFIKSIDNLNRNKSFGASDNEISDSRKVQTSKNIILQHIKQEKDFERIVLGIMTNNSTGNYNDSLLAVIHSFNKDQKSLDHFLDVLDKRLDSYSYQSTEVVIVAHKEMDLKVLLVMAGLIVAFMVLLLLVIYVWKKRSESSIYPGGPVDKRHLPDTKLSTGPIPNKEASLIEPFEYASLRSVLDKIIVEDEFTSDKIVYKDLETQNIKDHSHIPVLSAEEIKNFRPLLIDTTQEEARDEIKQSDLKVKKRDRQVKNSEEELKHLGEKMSDSETKIKYSEGRINDLVDKIEDSVWKMKDSRRRLKGSAYKSNNSGRKIKDSAYKTKD